MDVIINLLILAIVIAVVASMWKTFVKAGKPGWAVLVPIYNIIVLLEIVGRPGWWVVLFLIPIVNIVVQVLVALDMAKSFGKDTGFGILLWLLPFVGYPMLGFGDAEYQGPAAAEGAAQ